MKIHIFALALALLAVAAKASPEPGLFDSIKSLFKEAVKSALQDKAAEPDFCGKYDCPAFTVKNKTDDYELRCYKPAYWVSTYGYGLPLPMGGQSSKMFRKLFKYIEGGNKLAEKIPMTVPVVTVVRGEGMYKKLMMSFYIHKDFQSKPSRPNDKSVVLKKKGFCAYVRSFGGYVLFYSQYEKQLEQLKEDLKRDGLENSYKKGIEVTAGYNKPWKLFGRRNEVMLLQA